MDTLDSPAVPARHPGQHAVMGLLAQHIPLSLLLDVLLPGSPGSQEILDAEGMPATAWWASAAAG